MDLSNEVLHDFLYAFSAKLRAVKVGGQKKSRPFGFEAMFFVILYRELMLSERSGFNPRMLQNLRAHNFEALGSIGSKTIFFERFDLYLYGIKRKLALYHF